LLDIHQAIYDAVAAGDASRARTAVQRHHELMLAHLAAGPAPDSATAVSQVQIGQPST
jgi:DNA-binding FadR family transcriptional regulator